MAACTSPLRSVAYDTHGPPSERPKGYYTQHPTEEFFHIAGVNYPTYKQEEKEETASEEETTY
jgi:hypothetical protein